jgi:hypothetical protein
VSDVARRRRAPTRAAWWSTVVVGLLCAAPVPGDIGACGQPVQLLDANRFFVSKQVLDCQRCTECGIRTATCATACKGDTPQVITFPADCEPLVHDGEVCLRRLLESSCGDYAGYVSDESPSVPTECNFCPPRSP